MRVMTSEGAGRSVTQLRRGVVEFCVLALLRDRQRYGFELVRDLDAADGLITSEGTIYPLLSRLRREGLVATTWQESEVGPPRRYYGLTPDGDRALSQFVGDWRRFRDAVDGVLGMDAIDHPAGSAAGPEHISMGRNGDDDHAAHAS
jgi:PadR family transcriptional regulator PadR